MASSASKNQSNLKCSVVMGSQSDWPVMQEAARILQEFGVPYEAKIVSAHRTPQRLHEFAEDARNRGIECIIAGAGGAAHLPGMLASMTTLPVVGVPIQSQSLSGWDSLLSIVQMPRGIPVGTMAINGAANAAYFAVSILAGKDPSLLQALERFRLEQTEKVLKSTLDEAPRI